MLRLFILILVCFTGCASSAHRERLADLDAQYASGQLDATQYHVKYLEEVQNYNAKRTVASNMLG